MNNMPVSDAPPQPETGTTSADSSTSGSPTLTERWATALAKLNLAGSMIGWESIRRGMKREDDLAEAHQWAYHQKLHGTPARTNSAGDEMGHMVLGDMVAHHHHPASPPSKLGAVGKLILGAALAGSGAGAGLALPSLLQLFQQPTAPAAPAAPAGQPHNNLFELPPDTDTSSVLKLETHD